MERFSLPYSGARGAFRADARRPGGEVPGGEPRTEVGQLPVARVRGGGEPLTVDWTHFRRAGRGSGSSTLLVISSGVHGVEGPAGSAVQAQKTALWLERLLAAGIDSLDLHALNPFGYATGRRVTERNVDLNRNCAAPGAELFRASNPGYEALRHVLEPSGRVHHPSLEAAKIVGGLLLELARSRDLPALAQAIAGGQRASPGGVFHGGIAPEPQVGPLAELFAARTRAYDGVIHLDVHTGYGPQQTLQLITEDPVSTAGAAGLLGGEQAPPGLVLAPVAARGGDVYAAQGTLTSLLRAQLSEAQQAKSVFIGAEHGTLGATIAAKLRTVAYMVLENQGSQFGYANGDAQKDVARWFRQLFNPQDRAWQASVLEQEETLLAAIIARYGVSEGAPAAR
ncbi:MAG: DUF2817 domain-containing protein [Proteobacteria bacterium]|nr:DUF2817 domain-containing protein [Pseudomonadota bacterium]